MSDFINGIKRIPKKHHNLKGFVSLPISGNTREITEELVESFKRLGVEIILFDLEEKFHHYMQIVNPVFYDKNKQEFSTFVESFIEKDFLFDIVKEKPDFIFSFTNGFLDEKALKISKLMGIKNLIFHTKDYSPEDEISGVLKYCDVLFTPPGFDKESVDFDTTYTHHTFLVGCDIHRYSPKELDKQYSVTIFGDVSLYRANIANNLIKSGVEVSIFGSGWKDYLYLPEEVKNFIIEDSDDISPKRWEEIFRKSELVLSLPYDVKRDGSVDCKLNYLTYVAAGCGATIIGYSKDSSLCGFTHSEDIMFYETESELLGIIKNLKSDKDLSKFLGLSAVENIRLHNTTTKRAEEILAFVEKKNEISRI